MVEIQELPISTKMKKLFENFFSKYSTDVLLHEFGKWGGKCAVCGHDLKWGFKSEDNMIIGRVCSANIMTIRKYGGDIDKVNFDRKVDLELKAMEKKKAEWEKKQKAIELEKKYNEEYKFCTEVIRKTMKDNYNFFESRRIISNVDDHVNNVSYEELSPHFYPAPHEQMGLSEIMQCNSWLNWLKDGVVNEFYLQKLRDLMQQKTPEKVVEDAKKALLEYEEKKKQREHEYDYNYKYFKKIERLQQIRLGLYDKSFVDNLEDFFQSKEYYTEKQRKAIDKLQHRYRKQLSEMFGDEIEEEDKAIQEMERGIAKGELSYENPEWKQGE